MGFKLPGIKVKNYGNKASSSPVKQVVDERSGKRFSEIDYDLISKDPLGRTKQFTSSVIGQKAENPDPFGLTFQRLDTRLYDTSNRFPYLKSRVRLPGAGDYVSQQEHDKFQQLRNRGFNVAEQTLFPGKFVPTYETGYKNVVDPNTGKLTRQEYKIESGGTFKDDRYGYTPEQKEQYRFDLKNILLPSASGYEEQEIQAKESSKLSNTLDEAYGALVREEITPDQFEETVSVVRDDFTNSGVFRGNTFPQVMTNEQINVYEDVIERGKAETRLKQEEALENSRNWFLPSA